MLVRPRTGGQGSRASRLALTHALALLALFGGFAACDGSTSGASGADGAAGGATGGVGAGSGGAGGSQSDRNQAAGQPCQMLHTDYSCTVNSLMCYGAGIASSCPGGALCAGDGNGMTCAYSCSQDSDCPVGDSATVCMQGCKARLLNGYCMLPALQAKLSETSCPTGSIGTNGVAGVSNF
jgi:hypothetical protein